MTLPQGWEEAPLFTYLELVSSGVKHFQGTKKYIDTGSLETGRIRDGVDVDYATRASRANMEVEEGDVLFAKMKDTEKVYLISKDDVDHLYSTGFAILRIKDKSKLLPKYIYFWLRTTDFQRLKNNESTGATQKAINETKLKNFKITVPPIKTQEKIIALLEKAEQIKNWRKEADLLSENFLSSVFLSLFGRDVNHYDKWPVLTIRELAKKEKNSMRTGPFGSNLLHSEFVESGIAVLGIDNVVENKFTWKKRRFITPQKYETLKTYRIYPRDLLISIMATIGRSAVVPDDIPLTINTKHLAAISLDENLANPYFISYCFQSHPFVLEQIRQKSIGAIMSGLNLSIIKEIKIKLPPIQLQNRFEKLVRHFYEISANQNKSRDEAENLFNAFSQKAFKGELV